MSLTEIILQV